MIVVLHSGPESIKNAKTIYSFNINIIHLWDTHILSLWIILLLFQYKTYFHTTYFIHIKQATISKFHAC